MVRNADLCRNTNMGGELPVAGIPIAKIMSMHIERALQMKSECIVADRN